MTYLPITSWNENDRPREKLVNLGPENLSDSELLAILLHKGYPGVSAVDLAREVIRECGGLEGIERAGVTDLTHFKGVGDAKAATLMAAAELGKRIASKPPGKKVNFSRPSAVHNYFRFKLRNKQEEYFYALLLNQKNELIKESMIAKGTLKKISVASRTDPKVE